MSGTGTTILCVVGARPNFMKIAPVIAALRAAPGLDARLLHTGQHYDVDMNERFFEQLGIPRPDINLEVGSSSHAVQTAEIMQRLGMSRQLVSVERHNLGLPKRRAATPGAGRRRSANSHPPVLG